MQRHIVNYNKIPILEFDDAAAGIAEMPRQSKLRIGTLDIRIASIALCNNALLITRNLRDFQKVPNLRAEDWTQP